MAKVLRVRCRCGWRGQFGAEQLGLSTECPECGREIYVTTDLAEFKNRNIGGDDFAFSEEPGAAEAAAEEQASTAKQAPTSSKRSRGKRLAAGQKAQYKSSMPRWAAIDRSSRSHGRARVSNRASSVASHPLFLLTLVVVLLGAGYLIYSKLDRKSTEEDGQDLGF